VSERIERRERSAHRAVILNVLGYSLSFINSVVIVRRFGASSATDAYFLALAIPSALVSILGASMAGAVQAVLARYDIRRRRRTLVLALGIAPGVSLGALALLHVALPGSGVLALLGSVHDAATGRLAAAWFPACSIGAMMSAVSLVLAAGLQAEGRYAAAALIAVLSAGVQTILLVIMWTHGTIILPAAYVAGQGGAALVAGLLSLRSESRPEPSSGPAMRVLRSSVFQLAWPNMSGAVVGSVVAVLQRALAVKLPAGELSSFTFGWTLGSIPVLLFGLLLGAPAVTEIGMRAAFPERVAAQARWLFVLTLTLLAPVCGAMAAAARDVIAIVYGDRLGTHTGTAVAILATLGIATILQVPALVFAKVFAGSGDTRTPTLWGVAGIIIGAAVMTPLTHSFGARGLVYAYTIEILVSSIAMTLAGMRRWNNVAANPLQLIAMVVAVLTGSFAANWIVGSLVVTPHIAGHIVRLAATVLGALGPLIAFALTTGHGRSILSRVLDGRLPIAPPESHDAALARVFER